MTEFDHIYVPTYGPEYGELVRHVASQGEDAGFSAAAVADARRRLNDEARSAAPQRSTHSYKITIKDDAGDVLDSFVQHVAGGPGLWLALHVSEARLRGRSAGHAPQAATATIERSCSCGEWPYSEYGDLCPSCPQAAAA